MISLEQSMNNNILLVFIDPLGKSFVYFPNTVELY